MPRGTPPIRVAIDNAERSLERRRARPPLDPKEPRGPDKIKAGQWTPNDVGLPSEKGCECPVQCLGIEGDLYHIIDSAGQYRAIAKGDTTHPGIQDLFALDPGYPAWAWPKWRHVAADKPPELVTFKDDKVREALFRACALRGLFSPTDKMRGRGAWCLRGGQLIYHAGEQLWLYDGARIRARDTGVIEGLLYPRLAPLPTPWTEEIAPADNPAGGLLETYRKWNWRRPEIDPVLLLGHNGVSFIGGALDWRPAVLLVGDRNTGKSTLQKGLLDLFGEALLQSADTTGAGVYQEMRHDARPVAIDEFEADADQRKLRDLVRLMRAAASGAFSRRGGADHQPVEFQMRSAFLFSAINSPLQSAQDLSRVAVLRLGPLDRTGKRPAPIDADTCGPMVLAQMMRQWPKFEETYALYRGALAAGGHDGRGQDTYGTLLACADLLLGPELAEKLDVPLACTDQLNWWTDNLAAENLPEVENAKPNWRNCLETLLTAQVEVWRHGVRVTVGKLLEDIREKRIEIPQGRSDLELTGLGLRLPGEIPGVPRDAGYALYVPNQSQLVARLFAGTPWQGVPGQSGPWMEALRQAEAHAPGVVISDRKLNRMSINGVQERCTVVFLSRFAAAPER